MKSKTFCSTVSQFYFHVKGTHSEGIESFTGGIGNQKKAIKGMLKNGVKMARMA